MANTRVGLTSGKEFMIDGSVEETRATIDRAGGRWVTFTAGETRIDVASETVAYLEAQPS